MRHVRVRRRRRPGDGAPRSRARAHTYARAPARPSPGRHHTPHRHARDGLFAKNDRLAQRNRAWLAARRALTVNLMSSPGSGKTTLLERTIRDLMPSMQVCVVEGDQETLHRRASAFRQPAPRSSRSTLAPAATWTRRCSARPRELDPPAGALVMVENVGNLVCPALFDLGESQRVSSSRLRRATTSR